MQNIYASEVRHRFASEAWLSGVEQAIDACVTEARSAGQLDGVSFSLCEVYESVPPEVNSAGRVVWSLVLDGGDAKFARTELDEADLKVVADYEVLEPVVRVLFDQGPPPEVAEALAAAAKQGASGYTAACPHPRRSHRCTTESPASPADPHAPRSRSRCARSAAWVRSDTWSLSRIRET